MLRRMCTLFRSPLARCLPLSAAATFAFAGCGGISDDTKLSELTVSEAKDLCLELAADYPEKSVSCGNGISIRLGVTKASCDDETPASDACTATAGDFRDCTAALYGQTDAEACMDRPLPAACAKLANC